MNTLLLALALAGPEITWTRTMEEARTRAAETRRPILWFQLLGDLDQEFC